MRPSEALLLNRDALRELSLRHAVTNPRVFGSVVHGNDSDLSDLDLLVDHGPATTLLKLAALELEAHRLLGVPVDIKTPHDLPPSIRQQVLSEAVPL